MRFYGAVGYGFVDETAPGVFALAITERSYYGDVTRKASRLEAVSAQPPVINADISLENSFSIMADDHAYENSNSIKYVLYDGQYWRVTSVEVRRPRLILTIGGAWNGPKA